MKRVTKRYISLILLVLVPSFIYADSIRGEVKSFYEFEKKVMKAKNLKQTLVVMDDDDTLTMMKCNKNKGLKNCQYLGGPAWFAWQDELTKDYINHGEEDPYRIADTQDELLNISTLLFAMNKMPYTEKSVPNVLTRLTNKGVKLLVETARGSDTANATTMQFSKLKTANGTFMDLIEENGLKFGKGKNKLTSLASPFIPSNTNLTRDITYQKGALFIAGQNKGDVLKYILSQYKDSKITEIFFIDDTLQNVKDMHKAFKNDPDYKVHALHYTAFNEHKDALTKGKNKEFFQQQAHTRWLTIKSMMEATLLKPNTK